MPHKDAEARAAYQREYRKAHPDERRGRYNPEQQKRASRKWYIKRHYGLTVEEYDAIFARGACDICGGTKRLCLDHDHETGRVRGLLCTYCNCALAWWEKFHEAATAYVR